MSIQVENYLSMPYDVREHIITNTGVIPRSIRPGVLLLLLPDAPSGGFIREFFVFTIIESDHECMYLKVDIPCYVFNYAMPKVNLKLSLKWDPGKNEMWVYREQTMSDEVIFKYLSQIIASVFAQDLEVHSLLQISNTIIVTRIAHI